jgi:hypothetical protein
MNGEDYHMTGAEQIRDFISVEQVAELLVNDISFNEVESGKPKIKNIGTGIPQTLKEFSEFWWKKWGATGNLHFGSIPYRKDEVMRFVPLIRENESKEMKVHGNAPKFWSYREAWKRIQSSFVSEHYLETISIQESILSDRLLSIGIRQNLIENKKEENERYYRIKGKNNSKWKNYLSFSTLIGVQKKQIITINIIEKRIGVISLKVSKPSILTLDSDYKANNLIEDINSWRRKRNTILHGLVKSHPGTATQGVANFLSLAKKTAIEGIWLCRGIEEYSRTEKQ